MLIQDFPKIFSSLGGLEDLPLAPPLYGEKKVFFVGFIILKTTGLISRFQHKNRFEKRPTLVFSKFFFIGDHPCVDG